MMMTIADAVVRTTEAPEGVPVRMMKEAAGAAGMTMMIAEARGTVMMMMTIAVAEAIVVVVVADGSEIRKVILKLLNKEVAV